MGARPSYLGEAWHSPKGKLIQELICGVTDGLAASLGFVIGVFGALHEGRIIVMMEEGLGLLVGELR